ncbi:TetR/AcrR family transcriptional regulator [Paraburkholderia sp. J10-1]|uniref:TetR/AcrR family transcriptional regulator n=1 Tax=Paraburkholderia sp. J10-1 TaxID=2805430 RepID=UPI002AB6E49F|nr:TetR/AcrR family transcriptional regulator [Paraburkholderia sp. J10-1]
MVRATLDQERRLEIGRQRREKTRNGIIETAFQVVRERGADEPMLEDFIAAAGVAKGTFYNHFPTKSELFHALGSYVADAIDERINLVVEGVTDPAHRIAVACRQFVRLCRERPEWGWILVRAMPGAHAGWSKDMQRGVLADVRAGVKQGMFAVPSVQVAVVMGMGALAMAIQTVLLEKTTARFGEDVAEMTLRAMGMDLDEAKRIAHLPIDLK